MRTIFLSAILAFVILGAVVFDLFFASGPVPELHASTIDVDWTKFEIEEDRTRMIVPIQCEQWIAMRGLNEPWRVRCVNADLTKRQEYPDQIKYRKGISRGHS